MRVPDLPNLEIASAQVEGFTRKLREMLAVAVQVRDVLAEIDVLMATVGQRPSVAASVGLTDGKKRENHGNR